LAFSKNSKKTRIVQKVLKTRFWWHLAIFLINIQQLEAKRRGKRRGIIWLRGEQILS
jgi:hypothetical protein